MRERGESPQSGECGYVEVARIPGATRTRQVVRTRLCDVIPEPDLKASSNLLILAGMNQTTFLLSVVLAAAPAVAEDWTQFQFNARHSGNAADRRVALPELGLQGAVPLSDGIYTAPVVADGKVYAVDGAGVAYCLDAASLQILWKFASRVFIR